jgi:hypothetical protein
VVPSCTPLVMFGSRSVPHRATLTDGLRTEEIIAAARQFSNACEWMIVRD